MTFVVNAYEKQTWYTGVMLNCLPEHQNRRDQLLWKRRNLFKSLSSKSKYNFLSRKTVFLKTFCVTIATDHVGFGEQINFEFDLTFSKLKPSLV